MKSDVYTLQVDTGTGPVLLCEISDLAFGQRKEKSNKHYNVSVSPPRVDVEYITGNIDVSFILLRIENSKMWEKVSPKKTHVEGGFDVFIADSFGTDILKANGLIGKVSGIFTPTYDLPKNPSDPKEWERKQMTLQLTYGFQRTY